MVSTAHDDSTKASQKQEKRCPGWKFQPGYVLLFFFLDEEWQNQQKSDACSQEDVFIGNERSSTIAVYKKLCVFQNLLANGRANNAGDQHLAEDPDTLESAGFAHGGVIPDESPKHGHTGKITAHHQKGTQEHGDGSAVFASICVKLEFGSYTLPFNTISN